MSELILSMDPGEVTGWSLWGLEVDLPIHRLEYGLIHGGIDGVLSWFERHLGELRPTIVIVEGWNRHRPKGDPTHPLQILGALKGACQALGIELVVQMPEDKALATDMVLKNAGLYITNAEARIDERILHMDGRDVNDSQIHALAFAKAMGHEPTNSRFWPED